VTIMPGKVRGFRAGGSHRDWPELMRTTPGATVGNRSNTAAS
jgi:hypothetical protein